ncbi:nitronate monooxygenase family protein [Aquihabitans sp. G128]|uniref:NAD(P)H-dependent flavin oxidoreductase n=1 Tax=Aquihabitans sp. G128 TaxID=2849779 RepID=UPI001C2275E9|nr:nitronate monooxygenase family protein [Aquihabitans sp. G128]QXC62989.1 nitronate monooxygenase family protein [Aquihabitans sp. G128]
MSDDPSETGSDPLRTRFCDLVGCRYPIVQTGMGWVSGANLTAATSAAGGFGILAAVTMTPDQLKAAVAGVKERTDAPFGVNFRADQPDLIERLQFVTGQGVKLVSFAGAPTKDAIKLVHDAGAVVVPTVGARRHAEKMLEWGVDGVIAQGGEGGGHTGTVPTSLLLPQVVDAVGEAIPVLGAGGFHSGAGLVAALAYGADGIAMGTRFLLTAESRVPDDIKARYTAASVFDTVVTTALDGAPQRVIRTEMIDGLEKAPTVLKLPAALRRALAFRKQTGTPLKELVQEGLAMRKSQDLSWAQLAMAANAPMLIKTALVDGDPSVGVLPTGQVTGVIGELPSVAELVEGIVADARATLTRLGRTRG